ncbi:hypothetical protein ACFVYD_28430 [Streptomyces sp. NPDC058301]|uniref:hypothetical protein n=1 Tax=Streptomyces sp. NPDC058301 TaxID=3346436 RepID=UPI0036EB064E
MDAAERFTREFKALYAAAGKRPTVDDLVNMAKARNLDVGRSTLYGWIQEGKAPRQRAVMKFLVEVLEGEVKKRASSLRSAGGGDVPAYRPRGAVWWEELRSAALGSGPVRLPAQRDALTTVVSVDDFEHQDIVGYRAERTAECLAVEPSYAYLDHVWAGGDLTPHQYKVHQVDDQVPLTLDVKVVNNVRQTVLLHEARMLVDVSRPDPQPVPEVRPLEFYLPGRRLDGSILVNHGGGMDDCALCFHLEHPARQGALSREHVLQLSRDGQPDSLKSVMTALTEAGVGDWRVGLDTFADPAYPNGLPKVSLVGTLGYTWTDVDGHPRRTTHRLRLPIYLRDLPPQVGPGASVDISARYAVELSAERADYRVTRNISHSVRPGDADRFQIEVTAPQSSMHDLRLVLLHAGARGDVEELDCGRITLRVFRTNYGKRQHPRRPFR